MDKLERIVVPVDFSPMSKRALRAALTVGSISGAEIHLLHVIPEYEVDSAFHIQLPGRGEIEAQASRWAEKAFQTYLHGESPEAGRCLQSVRYGKPDKVICAYANEVGADLILLASHGRSGIERAVFGSVADKVLRLCAQAVMVVKADGS